MPIYLPSPLPHQTFYILLALSRGEAHGYSIGAIAHNDSLGGLPVKDGSLYPLLKKMTTKGLIEESGLQPTQRGQERMHYRITSSGKFRLKEELQRLEYALKIGRAAHLMDSDVPLEIQKWLDSVR